MTSKTRDPHPGLAVECAALIGFLFLAFVLGLRVGTLDLVRDWVAERERRAQMDVARREAMAVEQACRDAAPRDAAFYEYRGDGRASFVVKIRGQLHTIQLRYDPEGRAFHFSGDGPYGFMPEGYNRRLD